MVLTYVRSFKDNRNLLLTVPNVSMTEIKAFWGLESGGMGCSVKKDRKDTGEEDKTCGL